MIFAVACKTPEMKANRLYLVIPRNKSGDINLQNAEGVFWKMGNARRYAKQLMGPEHLDKWKMFYKVVKFIMPLTSSRW